MSEKYLEALKYVNGKIADLEDDLQHYTMVDKDKCREFFIREDLKQFTNIQQALNELKTIKEVNPSEALSRIEDCLYEDPYADRNDISYENDIAAIKQALLKPSKFSNELLKAKKDGFFDGYGMWRDEEFVIDYDTIRKEFCLRSITMGYTLGKTRFYESDYKKTWWLDKNKEE